MTSANLVFVGIKGSVVALSRATGAQVWAVHLKGGGFVNMHLLDTALLAVCEGEVFCLDATSGAALWHNPLKGFGVGLATIASGRFPGSENATAPAAQAEATAQSAAAAAVVIMTAATAGS